MKAILNQIGWAGGAVAVLYLVLCHDGYEAFTGPMGTIGLGLIGLGIWRTASEESPANT